MRRERNRQAQSVFRKRRQAAEEAQKRRVQQLETTVERMSQLLIGLCDEMMDTEEVARQPSLMARLQHSTAQTLELVRSVICDRTDSGEEFEGIDKSTTRQCNAEQTHKHDTDSDSPARDSPSKPLHPFVAGTPSESFTSIHADECHSDNVEVGHPSSDTLLSSSQGYQFTTPHIAWGTTAFPLRLLEITLSRARLCLSGDIMMPAEEFQRSFGSSLRLRTREQLATHMRWLLGPGRNHLHQIIGSGRVKHPSKGAADSLHTVSSSLEKSVWQSPGLDDGWDDFSFTAQQDYLTAVGVQEQLESLGAKMVDPDTIELSINNPHDRVTTIFKTCTTTSALQSAPLVVRLSLPLLETNLAQVAMCFVDRPVYPRREIVKVIEASVVSARGGEPIASIERRKLRTM